MVPLQNLIPQIEVTPMSKIHYSIDGDVVRIETYEGEKYSEKTSSIQVVEFALEDCPTELKDGEGTKSFAAYGLLKWLQDRTSQVKGAVEKLAAMETEFAEKATQGLWKKPSEGRAAGSRSSRRKISATLAQAVAELTGQTALDAEAQLKALSKEQFEGLAGNPKVQERVAELEEAQADATDSSALADLIGDVDTSEEAA